MPAIPELDVFARLASALEPWLGQAVIVGGWAHRLYRLHPHAQELDYAPLMTIDADVAVPSELSAKAPDIRERLLAHGFTEEFLGDDRPPATHYRLGNETSGFYAEFLTPLAGGGYDRKGKRKATVEIAGVSLQQLRYLELLLQHPWQADIRTKDFAGQVSVANPVGFLVQKVLIHGRRDRDDRAKDILYMHDTFEVFGSRLDGLREQWRQRVAADLHRRSATRVRQSSRILFGAVSDDIRRAALIPADRRLSPESIMQACRFGFEEVFR
ncbi:MAG: hypothetical protein HY822_04525 [Acidobacteria bacterium]|nr:hypothetical protein [Acidobacteriota bacterium]